MTLNELFTNIANAIRRKKGTTDKIIPTNFESEIESIESGTDTTDATATASDILKDKVAYGKEGRLVGAIETYDGASDVGGVTPNTLKNLLDNTKSASYLFKGYLNDNLSDLIQYSDTENVEDFSYMNDSCKATILPTIDTHNGIKFNAMNYYCQNLIKVPRLNTDKGTYFGYMNYFCTLLPKLDISKFTSTSTNNSGGFCYGCLSLKALIIRSFGDTYVLNSDAFYNCHWLNGKTNATYNPNGEQGYIYVPRDMITTLQNETNWSTMQFRALEDYTKDGTTTGEFDDEKAGI